MRTNYNIGDEVYLKTDTDQIQRLIVGICITQNSVKYKVACSTSTSWHFDFEISREKDVLLLITNDLKRGL